MDQRRAGIQVGLLLANGLLRRWIHLYVLVHEGDELRPQIHRHCRNVGHVFQRKPARPDRPRKKFQDGPGRRFPPGTSQICEASFWQKLSLKDQSRPQLMHHRVKQQLAFVLWPNVFYAGFAYGSTLIWFNVLNATASIVLTSPPYNFSAGIVVTTYVACLIGVALGFTFTGRLSDWLAIKLARRNNGIMEPEHRQWLFAASSIIIPFALILWGCGCCPSHPLVWLDICNVCPGICQYVCSPA